MKFLSSLRLDLAPFFAFAALLIFNDILNIFISAAAQLKFMMNKLMQGGEEKQKFRERI